MKTKPILLDKGQKISQLDFFKQFGIIANAIYNKTIPGCGFTRYAIEFFLHHLICILPNVPVIQDKVRKHNENNPGKEILGVHKGITIARIKEYLQSGVQFKKILTTPEGFEKKVLKAFNNPEEMKQMFFLLFDECERIVTDISYRGAIAAPLNIFFEFPKKAMVSATTLPFTDERFKEFAHYCIEPTYDYSIPMTVINTNNIAEAVKKHIEKLNSPHNCIFLNSTLGIKAVVDNLDISGDSIAFCAEDSVLTLKENGFYNAFDHFDPAMMTDYSFFTSRYFSAIDIELDYKPDIIIISDVFFAKHSILDPKTEIIQIAGRFRNGVNSITHITNYNPAIEWMNHDEAFYFLKGSLSTFEGFVNGHKNATNPGSRKTFGKAIDEADEKRYFVDGKLNKFMVDNFIHEERVKGYYEKPENLKAAYEAINKHFTITFKDDFYVIDDCDLFMLHSKQTVKEKWQIIAELFAKWTPKFDKFVFPPTSMLSKLVNKYPEIYKAYRTIGLEGLEAVDYVKSEIERAVNVAETQKRTEWLAVKVYAVLNEHVTYSEVYILEKLKEVYAAANIDVSVKAAYIRKFFEATRTTQKGIKAYKLGKKIF